MPQIDTLLRYLKDHDGSDLHLAAGLEPRIRARGMLEAVPDWKPFTHESLSAVIREIADEKQWSAYDSEGDLDFAYGLEGVGRFRANFFRQERGPGAVFRIIPEEIVPLEKLRLPKAVEPSHE